MSPKEKQAPLLKRHFNKQLDNFTNKCYSECEQGACEAG